MIGVSHVALKNGVAGTEGQLQPGQLAVPFFAFAYSVFIQIVLFICLVS
jgi:hypothetical protein